MSAMRAPVICLMGPTTCGKTALAIQLVQRFPCDIISVDSAMVYRGMDIGTAKPDAATLQLAPHRLINCLDPAVPYSAGQFCQDVAVEIDAILKQGRIPLLVGGTMLYFRALQYGLAKLPTANPFIRQHLSEQAERTSWAALHDLLHALDPDAATRIHPHDKQRIQRALEVFLETGAPISSWQQQTEVLTNYQIYNLALIPEDRELLTKRIADRFAVMLEMGFISEVATLYHRGDLYADLPAIRAVGYRQLWQYLEGEVSYLEMQRTAISATRQLAKQQLTWLRTWPALTTFAMEAGPDPIYEMLGNICEQCRVD